MLLKLTKHVCKTYEGQTTIFVDGNLCSFFVESFSNPAVQAVSMSCIELVRLYHGIENKIKDR